MVSVAIIVVYTVGGHWRGEKGAQGRKNVDRKKQKLLRLRNITCCDICRPYSELCGLNIFVDRWRGCAPREECTDGRSILFVCNGCVQCEFFLNRKIIIFHRNNCRCYDFAVNNLCRNCKQYVLCFQVRAWDRVMTSSASLVSELTISAHSCALSATLFVFHASLLRGLHPGSNSCYTIPHPEIKIGRGKCIFITLRCGVDNTHRLYNIITFLDSCLDHLWPSSVHCFNMLM